MKKMFTVLLALVLFVTALPTLATNQPVNARVSIDVSAMPKDAQAAWNELFTEERDPLYLFTQNVKETYEQHKSSVSLGYEYEDHVFCVSGIGSMEFWEIGNNENEDGELLYSFDLSLKIDKRGERTLDFFFFPIFQEGWYEVNYASAPQKFVDVEIGKKMPIARTYLKLASELWTRTPNNDGNTLLGINVHFLGRDRVWYHGFITSEDYQLVMRPTEVE